MQPFQYDLRSSAAKDNSITHAAAAPSNLDAATTMRSAEIELQKTIELRAMASEIAVPKPGISTPKRKKDDFEALFKRNFKRKIISAKIGKICWQITFAAWMQPFQYDLRSSAAKDNSITHAAAAPSNLDTAITMRSVETELQSTIELRAIASEIAAPKPGSRRQSDKKTILKHFFKGIVKGKLLAPKLRQSSDKSLSQPGCSHSNTIYNLQLQKTIVLRMQPRHQATLMQPLPCVSQHHVANLHVPTHITTPEHQMTTVMQPFQCDLPPEIPKHPITTHTQAHPKQLQATVTLRQKKRQTDRSRTRRTHEVAFIAACSHFTRKNTRFRAPASSPRHSPCNIMQPWQDIAHATSCSHDNAVRSINSQTCTYLHTEQHQNTKWQQSCSHSNAICKHRFQNTL